MAARPAAGEPGASALGLTAQPVRGRRAVPRATAFSLPGGRHAGLPVAAGPGSGAQWRGPLCGLWPMTLPAGFPVRRPEASLRVAFRKATPGSPRDAARVRNEL